MADRVAPPATLAASAANSAPAQSPVNSNLAYLNPIDRTAYTKNVVNSHTTAAAASSMSSTAGANHATSASTASSAPPVFNPALLAAQAFDPHTFITTTLSQQPSSTSAAPPTLQSLHASLTAYSSTLHASLVQLLNQQYEAFITLSSSLLPLPPLLSTLEDYAEQVREKSRAMLLVLQDKREEEESKRREWTVEEERERWLTELNDCLERVRMVQAVMAEVEEAAEADRMATGSAEEGEESWVTELAEGDRAAVRRAVQASREGAGSEEKRRREERRQNRREDQNKRLVTLPATAAVQSDETYDDEDDVDDDDDYEADEAIKRQHNQAYDLFLSLLATPPTNSTADLTSATSQPTLSSSQLYRLTHLTFLFISLRASMTLMSQFQLVSSLQSTVSSLYASFLSHLQRALLTALSSAPGSSSTSSPLTSVLRLYVLLDERSACELIVKEQLLLPALQSIFSSGVLRTNPSASSGGGAVSNLGVLYERVLELAERVVCVLNEATYTFSPHSFDWFGDVFFTTLATQLTTLTTALFSPGTPTVFHYHYTLSCSLLSSLSALATASSAGVLSEGQSHSLLSHPAVDGFLKRWNLSIYFMLRFQQLATSVEAACSLPADQQVGGRGSDSGGWRVPAVSGVVENAMLQCWADGVWLAELTGQFLKLTLQCLERYCTLVEAGCKLTTTSSANASATGATTADSGGTAAAASSGEVSCVFPIELLYAYHDDVERMDAFIAKRLTAAVLVRLPAGSDSSSSLASTLSPTVTRLRSLPPLLVSSLTALMSSAAAIPLSAVPRLTKLSRMSKKGPTAPSSYVAQLLAALVKQQSEPTQPSKHTAQWRHELLRLVVSRVCDMWGERVQSVLDAALKMEASLRLLKKKGADGAGGGDASEVEKIRGQLELDVREFERGVRDELGVAVEEVQQLQQLQRLVHSFGANHG